MSRFGLDLIKKKDFGYIVIQKRGAAVLEARKLSSAMSAAKAIGDHLRDWICGSNGRWVSMAVNSTGNSYNIPEGLIYSFPVTCEGKISEQNRRHRSAQILISIFSR